GPTLAENPLSVVALVFCTIPQYIHSFVRRNIAAPIMDAVDRVRREFEFDVLTTYRFDVNLNASKSLGEVAMDIMEGVRLHLEPTRRVLGLFTHITFFAILFMYIHIPSVFPGRCGTAAGTCGTTIYIARCLVELDLRQAERGKPTVLPLRAWERGRYIPPAGLLSRQERRRYGLQLVGVLRHVLLGLSIILGDYSLFWVLDLVQHHLQGEIVARAPAVMGVSVNGTGYSSEIFRDLVSAFGVLQQGNVSVLSQRCILQPVEPDYSTYLSIGLLYGICLFIAVFGVHVARLRRAVCAAYYPLREQERTFFLHSTILARRTGLIRALHQAATNHASGAGQGKLLLFLTSRLPAFARLARLLGIQQKRCLACRTAEQPDFVACITPGCKGLYCSECYETLNNICSICMSPLSHQDIEDEE
ncbi:PREDICTED: DC-STAMP domain-containing protein 2, partial [Leptosomus discolor]|uniref:DC-STAMP domain-containing protein 2 n=1 Tax=Leptosomus discolor TaxID=188344 RepID=UPI000522B013